MSREEPPSERRAPREFAVLVPFLLRDGTPHIAFAVRPERSGDHYSGQVCFPGGGREPEDSTLVECALRESWEELSIPRASVAIFAELDFRRTSIHHRVKPYAGLVHGDIELAGNEAEVAKILYLPLDRVNDELFELRQMWKGPDGKDYPLYRFDLEGHEVWGLTAGILRDFFLHSEEFRAELRNQLT